MMHSAAIIDAAADELEASAPAVPLVVDPVMVASTGARLFDDAAVDRLRQRLIPRAAVLTPNLPEAELLSGLSIATLDDMRRAADILLRLGPKAVVVKGGHLTGDKLYDLVADGGTSWTAEAQRIETRATHGTGCTLASAIATGLAQRMTLRAAFDRAHAYLQSAIRNAPNLGQGHGPLGVGWAVAGPVK
jgi:hydroxymethylpyrimidine/phosphomethylpyrimidine kinase